MIVYKITNSSPCFNSGKPAFHMGRDHPNQNHEFFCVYVFQLRKWKVAWPLAWNPGMKLMMLRVAAHELSIHIAHTCGWRRPREPSECSLPRQWMLQDQQIEHPSPEHLCPYPWDTRMRLDLLRMPAHELPIHVAHAVTGGACHEGHANAAYRFYCSSTLRTSWCVETRSDAFLCLTK